MAQSKPWSPLVYNPLGKSQIRVLYLEPSSDDTSMISCQLRPVNLRDVAVKPGVVENKCDRQWQDPNQTSYDYPSLFKPRRGLLDRSLKAYMKSLDSAAHKHSGTVDNHHEKPDLSDRYVALSYMWGDPSHPKPIKVNGVQMEINPNLHAALTELRKSKWVIRRVNFWIDALCINQADLDERGQQVKLMRDIYAMSWQVVVWLGPNTPSTTMAYCAMDWLVHKIGSSDKLREFAVKYGIENITTHVMVETTPYTLPCQESVYEALRTFFACTYWHRLWILQELAMAKPDAPVVWGNQCMLLGDIWKACELIESQEDLFLQSIPTPDDVNPVSTIDRRLHDREGSPALQWKHLLRIQHMRDQEHKGINTALPALELAQQAQATDPRDKVYGVLGIPCVQGLSSISPNYRIELPEIYANFSRDLISKNGNGLDILRLGHSPIDPIELSSKTTPFWKSKQPGDRLTKVATPCPHDLPSWVVCWSCTRAPLVFLPGTYNANRGLQNLSGIQFPSSSSLSLDAIFIDSIATLSAFSSLEANHLYPHNCTKASTLPNAYGTLEGLRHALWKTIIADTTSKGGKPPSSWAILRLPQMWSHTGISEGGRSLFGLSSFHHRNKELVLGGIPFKEIVVGYDKKDTLKVDNEEAHKASDADKRESSTWAANVLAWRRIIGTREGRIGLTVAATKESDSIAILPDCSVPLVLRPEGTHWKVVGECFVYGLMDGEVASLVHSGRAAVKRIELR